MIAVLYFLKIIKMPKIFVCWDTHWFNLYEFDAKRLNPKIWKQSKSLTKDDVLIVLWDFWYLWYDLQLEKELENIETQAKNYKKQLSQLDENIDKEQYDIIKEKMVRLKILIKRNYKDVLRQKRNLDKLAWMNYTIAVVPWNHENYNAIFSLPEEEKWWNKVWALKRNTRTIYFLKRWEVYNINWKRIFSIWWALSIDKAWRTEEKDWWMLEYLTNKEINNALDNAKKYKEFDYVLSHTCPISIAKKILQSKNDLASPKLEDKVSFFLEKIYKEIWIKFKQWHFWHFHTDTVVYENNEAKFFCHYKKAPYELE